MRGLLAGERSCAGLPPQLNGCWILGGAGRGGLVVAFHYGVYTLVVR